MNEFINDENELAHAIIGIAIDIHKTLGPGLEKDTYLECLMYELNQQNYRIERDVKRDLFYKNIKLGQDIHIDLLVNDILVVEIETVETVSELEIQKLLKILKNGNHKLGLVINFNSTLLKNGIRRVSNTIQIEN
jgi:GxxExxY protein